MRLMKTIPARRNKEIGNLKNEELDKVPGAKTPEEQQPIEDTTMKDEEKNDTIEEDAGIQPAGTKSKTAPMTNIEPETPRKPTNLKKKSSPPPSKRRRLRGEACQASQKTPASRKSPPSKKIPSAKKITPKMTPQPIKKVIRSPHAPSPPAVRMIMPESIRKTENSRKTPPIHKKNPPAQKMTPARMNKKFTSQTRHHGGIEARLSQGSKDEAGGEDQEGEEREENC